MIYFIYFRNLSKSQLFTKLHNTIWQFFPGIQNVYHYVVTILFLDDFTNSADKAVVIFKHYVMYRDKFKYILVW